MNLNQIFSRAWKILWQYRALWLFGAILALVGANTIFPLNQPNWEDNSQWINIKLSEDTTIRFPGADITIDLTDPGGIRIINENDINWREFNDLVHVLDQDGSVNLWPILVETVIILVGLALFGIITRYIVETAVIHMVYNADQTGKYLSVREGFRRGFSQGAWRLFLLDFAVGLLSAVIFIVVFGLAITPILLAIGRHKAIIITAGVGTFSLFILAFYLWLAISTILSLVLQTVRRICVLEKQSLLTSINQGLLLTKHHIKDLSFLWLFWVSLRLIWLPLAIPILFLLVPILILTALLGVAVGGIPAIVFAAITDIFVGGVTPWIMGALAGLPLFILVLLSPILFVNGFVEIYKSSIWTIAYRDLKTMELAVNQIPPIKNLALGEAD